MTGTTPASSSTRTTRIGTVAAATVATVLTWIIASVLFDVDVTAKTGGSETEVNVVSVILATVVSGLLGWGLLELLERKASNPRTVFTISTVVVFVLSLLGGPLGGVTTGAKVTLVLLHAVAALVLIPGLARTARKR
ncbi:DUF6069 family protein [Streptomyces sp. NPDC005438]|uniref:DUF6069 family protein n=1 Tax=Streptomyces sp. NPDC005438 TaxID=3156880 RepID=UPI0033BDE2AF